jgi:two-component system, NtrC family, sensor histidine kinase HydH
METVTESRRPTLSWIDFLLLVFLAGLALLYHIREIHKQLTLLALGIIQLLEGRIISRFAQRGAIYIVCLKIALATLLIGHTAEIGINSSYYPIYYVPVITAAIYFGPWGTLLWTAVASLAYSSYLIPALKEYELTRAGLEELVIRILFFFFAAVLVNRFVMENRKQVARYQALSEDLAESNRQLRQVQEEARRAERLAALGQLSAGLAHEIRNPLGVIKGSAEMLTKKLQASQPLESELAGYISSEVIRLNALVARFLDFARPSHLDLRPVDAVQIVERALKAAEEQFPHASVTVDRQYSAALPKIAADEQLCEQVFVNLIANAYEAMEEAPKKLMVSISPDSIHGAAAVAVEIRDSGPGVPANLREQIFNPFFTSKPAGVGLGLAIVAKIVDDHHGLIRLMPDEAGKGACFRVVLPARPKE